MSKIEMVRDAMIDTGYEFYQTIIDFDHPIQIFREAYQNSIDEGATDVYCRVSIEKTLGQEDLYIDIWDNGKGLAKEDVDCFFGLAKSTKVDGSRTPLPGKLGYKGHGTKIFFKSERVEICSKIQDGEVWGAILEDAIKQIRDTGSFKYSGFLRQGDLSASVQLPEGFETGFFLRIKNPTYFKTQYTRFMLNHLYLRDYSKWYTVFGNVRTAFNRSPEDRRLFLQGLNFDNFVKSYKDFKAIDPCPVIVRTNGTEFEKIVMGHHFPDQRHTESEMKKYAKKLELNKPYSHYYSKEIFKEKVYLDNNLFFDFVIHVEGYETKRRYDILLARGGRSSIPDNMRHTDGERYGLWACKGGVPIEKIDDWILGGKGAGAYTYMHAFVDCDFFELTGTRGSIRNTDLEVIEKVKEKVNEILSDTKIKKDLAERQEWEDMERTLQTIEEQEQDLKKRYKHGVSKKKIRLPGGRILLEPTKTKSGYSESETLILLIQLLAMYPKLFPFDLLDYNTSRGIDFVIKQSENPSYIELKGSMQYQVNHSFRHISKFICYDIELRDGDTLFDNEQLKATLSINKEDKFSSPDDHFKGKKATSYQLLPPGPVFRSIEVIVLKKVLEEIIGAKFD